MGRVFKARCLRSGAKSALGESLPCQPQEHLPTPFHWVLLASRELLPQYLPKTREKSVSHEYQPKTREEPGQVSGPVNDNCLHLPVSHQLGKLPGVAGVPSLHRSLEILSRL